MDGAPQFTGFNTILGPNKVSCMSVGGTEDDRDGIFNPSSQHVGGVHCLMGDGAVRFISENISTGNTSLSNPMPTGSAAPPSGPSPYGVWGALGSINGADISRQVTSDDAFCLTKKCEMTGPKGNGHR